MGIYFLGGTLLLEPILMPLPIEPSFFIVRLLRGGTLPDNEPSFSISK